MSKLMQNVRLEGRIYVSSLSDGYPDGGAMIPCELDDPRCQTVDICWGEGESVAGSALMNENRLGYDEEESAQKQWEKTLACARLMAAAPDLLAALEKCVLALRFHDWNALLAAGRAIAKAKGEEFDPRPQIKYRREV